MEAEEKDVLYFLTETNTGLGKRLSTVPRATPSFPGPSPVFFAIVLDSSLDGSADDTPILCMDPACAQE